MELLQGLSSRVAKARLDEVGSNSIEDRGKRSFLKIFFAQFSSWLVLLLLLAACFSLTFAEYIDAGFIIFILMLNAVLGFYQEFKADEAVDALRQLSVGYVRAVRDGKETEILSTKVVPGDIIVFAEGDKVVADGVVIDGKHLEVSESSLTGESMPVEKEAIRISLLDGARYTDGRIVIEAKDEERVWMGTFISKGRGKMLVSATGMNTRFGILASELTSIDRKDTPLGVQLNTLGKYLGLGAIGLCAFVFVIGYVRGIPFGDILLLSISLAVAAVPEGLPAIVTVALALGVFQMSKRNAIVRRLMAVETLGSTQIICTDKTGTLTTNKMRVREVALFVKENGKAVMERIDAKRIVYSDVMKLLVDAGIVCNTAEIVNKGGDDKVVGDTTEGALLYLAEAVGKDYRMIRSHYRLIEEFPFDARRKLMSVVVAYHTDGYAVFVKGAPENLIERCDLSDGEKQVILSELEQMARRGLRTLAIGYKEMRFVRGGEIVLSQVESNLNFLGIVAIADPPREEVRRALDDARRAGIRTIMVTGDNPVTAQAIGQELGLLQQGELVWEGRQFSKMNERDVYKDLWRLKILARSAPEDKLRLVRLLQSKGYVVAVTGDGVNDALAITQANIGITMGITGTDVAKESADMVLVDDNYATIIAAIGEGRRIYRNIMNAVHYLVSTNIGEILAVVGSIVLFPIGDAPRTPAMILWINLITDGLPALVLATDVSSGHAMEEKPRDPDEQIITRKNWWSLFAYGILIASVTIVTFWLGYQIGGLEAGRAWSFMSIVFMQMVRLVLIRKALPFNNWRILGVLLLTFVLQVFVTWWEPTRVLFGIVGN